MFKNVLDIDQTPIGRSPRSNPATYIGFFNLIRDLFSKTKDAKLKAYNSSYFSFNVDAGRCPECAGQGLIKLEMKFLENEYIKCNKCKGTRFKEDILNIKYKNKNISEVLDLTVLEALDFFKNIKSIYNKLKTLEEVGLSYIKLGQSATSFSGGEAQRIKISKELCKQTKGETVYILDEPTTGLHFDDINKLINILTKLRDKNNTIIIIEHNPDLIKSSDYIIELGPKGGEEGGYLIAEGTFDEIIKNNKSLTALFLKNKI
jgi:excinuclease ABC subunit A